MDIMLIATAWDWSQIEARYQGFFIEDEASNYKLHSGMYYFLLPDTNCLFGQYRKL